MDDVENGDQNGAQSAVNAEAPLRNIRMVLAYDGTDFAGWQFQPGQHTLQGVLQDAIEQMTGERPPVHASGRTDAGVHALGQVANFHTRTRLSCFALYQGLHALMPQTVSVLRLEDAPLAFHSRYQTVRKRYRYVIDNSPHPVPFLRKFSHFAIKPLDVPAMHTAAQVLVGTHDFRSFESDWPNRESSIRTVEELTVARHPVWPIWGGPPQAVPPGAREKRTPEIDCPLVCIDIVADGFLYNMVRAIAGTLLDVGRGRWTTANVAQILHAQDRKLAGTTAPAAGLFLVQVDYPEFA